MFFFGFQGFVVYSLDCDEKDFSDFHIPILEAIEFSNGSWAKRWKKKNKQIEREK